jgi:hypothetical protein
MATQKVNIDIQTKGAKKSKDELSGLTGAINKVGKAAGIASAAYFGAKGLIAGFQRVIDLSATNDVVSRGFNNLAKSSNFSSQAFQKFQRATDGTISSIELMTQANNAMLLGITDSEDQMAEMFDIAQRLASALGKDTAFGVESLVTGLGRQSKLMLDNLGIMVDVEKANQDFAQSLGKTVEQLTDQEKKQAFVNATLDSARELVNNLGEEQLTTNDSIARMSASFDDLSITLGNKLSPIFTSLANGITKLIDSVDSGINKIDEFGEEINGVLIDDKTTEIEKFRESIRGLNEEELLKFQENFVASNTLLFDNGKNVDIIIEKNKILLDSITKINEAQQAQNEKIEELGGTIQITNEIRRSDLDMDIKKVASVEIIKKDMRDQINLSQNLASALQTAFDPDLGAGEAFKGFILQIMSSMQGVILASKAMSEALSFAFVPGAGVAGSVAALLALEAAKAGVRSIQFAETGFDGVVNSPTMFVTGESGAERVQVTPLQGPNINGPQGGGGITVNISAPLVDETVVESIIPAIEKAQRQNLA